MFLVQLTSGSEQVYPTRADFVAAIRNGQIDAGSLIFHRATARWISITEHPEHRKFRAELLCAAGPGASAAHEAVTPPPDRKAAGPLRRLAEMGAWLGRKTATARHRWTPFP